MRAQSPGLSGAAHLAALREAIPALVVRLGGHLPPGSWQYGENRLRIAHRPGAGISAMYKMPAGTGFNELGVTTESVTAAGSSGSRLTPAGNLAGQLSSSGVASLVLRPTLPIGHQLAAGTCSTSIPEITVTGWIHPHDPRLPALSLATDRTRVQEMWGEGEALSQLRTVAYRPLRRAVLEASFTTRGPLVSTRKVFLKVGHEEAISELVSRHAMLAHTQVPAPAVLGPRHPGIIALEAGRGISLSAAIRQHAGTDLNPLDFTALLDQLPQSLMRLPAKGAWSDSIRRYQQAATLTLPHRERELKTLVTQIQTHLQHSDRGELVPTHGDFYDANLLLEDGKISALLDLDSLGPGYRVDDLACLLGHLAILPSLGEKNQAAGPTLARFGEVFELSVDPRNLWARSAAVALTLIAGSRNLGDEIGERVAEARLAAARELLWRADAFA